MANEFKPLHGALLLQNMLQGRSAGQRINSYLAELAAIYPNCDVQIGEHDEVFLIAKNDNPDLKTVGERVHAAAEGMLNALGAREQREPQMWDNWAGGWKEGLQGLLDMAHNARATGVHDFYVCPPLRPRLVKSKKGPRRYRVRMVRCYYAEDLCSKALGGIPARIHQATKMPGFTS